VEHTPKKKINHVGHSAHGEYLWQEILHPQIIALPLWPLCSPW
jgi:hypothetical protein